MNAISKSKSYNSQSNNQENNDESLISPKLNRKNNTNVLQNDSINNIQTNQNLITNNKNTISPNSSHTSSPPSVQSPVSMTHAKTHKPIEKNSINKGMRLDSNDNLKSSSIPNCFNSRPINEATKFDSLEDITKVASFQAVTTIEDQQAIRAVDIHPSGNYYVVGSNSKCLRVLPYPSLDNIKSDHICKPASVLYKKSKHHYGSIYCTAWNPSGNLIATGSNDKTIKLIKFDPELLEDNGNSLFDVY